MNRKHPHPHDQRSESGSSLIEVAIAGLVLLVGMLAVMTLLAISIGNNGKSKVDSTATMLTQAVLEQLTSSLKASGGVATLTDCTPTTWTINPGGVGANLSGAGIDFTQSSPPAESFMNYAQCDSTGNVQAIYDVRWNVQPVGTHGTYLVTVGARPKVSGGNKLLFSIPVNMRSYVGGYN